MCETILSDADLQAVVRYAKRQRPRPFALQPDKRIDTAGQSLRDGKVQGIQVLGDPIPETPLTSAAPTPLFYETGVQQ
ncbi:MAG: hypothetical protein WD425_19310 [Nitrospirales bacterium]